MRNPSFSGRKWPALVIIAQLSLNHNWQVVGCCADVITRRRRRFNGSVVVVDVAVNADVVVVIVDCVTRVT